MNKIIDNHEIKIYQEKMILEGRCDQCIEPWNDGICECHKWDLESERIKDLEWKLSKEEDLNKTNRLIDIDLIEQMAFSYPDPEIEGWRNYRISYGGCNEDCYWESNIWLPPLVDADVMGYKLFEILQVPEARLEFEKMVEKIHKEKVSQKSNWRTIE
jgi:hypothetical protein